MSDDRIHVTLTATKVLKHQAEVRAWLKKAEEAVEEELNNPEFLKEISEAALRSVMGLPQRTDHE